MVVHDSFPTPKKFGLIFIDCWESMNNNGRYSTAVDTVTQLTNLTNFTNVVKIFATYDYDLAFVDNTLLNTIKLFSKSSTELRMYVEEFLATVSNDRHYSPRRVSSELLSIIDSSAFAAHSIPVFSEILKRTSTDVTDWIVIGGAWQQCYHYRDLGVMSLFRSFNDCGLTFYSLADGTFIKSSPIDNNHYHQDFLQWAYNGELYKLTGIEQISL